MRLIISVIPNTREKNRGSTKAILSLHVGMVQKLEDTKFYFLKKILVVLRNEPRDSHMPDKHSKHELRPWPFKKNYLENASC